jgi:hypothetical protein
MLSAVDQLNRLGERARSGQASASMSRPAEFIAAPAVPLETEEGSSRRRRRAERRELKAALKAVRLPGERRAASPATAPTEASRPGDDGPKRWLRRKREEPAPLTTVAIAETPEPEPAPAPPRHEPTKPAAPSIYPTPTYIPQAEYARMLREQRAAEKAAAAAAAELRELADLEQKEGVSDWGQ